MKNFSYYLGGIVYEELFDSSSYNDFGFVFFM